jgi:HlyD family secretion protein
LQIAKQAVSAAQNKLALTLTTPEELLIGEANVEQAQAQADQIRAQIGKNMIISPIFGVVTRQDAKVGETANPGVNVVTVMSAGQFEITANVPEVDVGKIALGNKVTITLDAYSGEVWTGRVSYVEPAETIIDGVVNYKIKVSFDKADQQLKSGLTANLTIETVRKDQVLILPQYAIIENDRGSFVEKNLGNNQTAEVAVKIGIRSQDGKVEIISGVKEGDEVLNVGLKKL